MSKYNNKRVMLDGEWFDSMREAARWSELRLMERVGEIRELRRQVPFELIPQQTIKGHKVRPIRYIADFVYIDKNGSQVVEDVKGMLTQVYRLKRRMLIWLYGIEVKET